MMKKSFLQNPKLYNLTILCKYIFRNKSSMYLLLIIWNIQKYIGKRGKNYVFNSQIITIHTLYINVCLS